MIAKRSSEPTKIDDLQALYLTGHAVPIQKAFWIARIKKRWDEEPDNREFWDAAYNRAKTTW